MTQEIIFLKSRAGYRGGLEKYTLHLAQAFATKGLPVKLLTTGTPPELPTISTLSLAPDTKFTLHHLLRFNALCNQWVQHNPNALVFGMERTTLQTHYRAGGGVHAVYLQRRGWLDPLWKRVANRCNPLHHTLLALEKKAFESPHLRVLFTNSEMVKGEILHHYNVCDTKIEVVHNGVEWLGLSTPFQQTFEKRRGGPFHFLFVGNGYHRKGLAYLLRGMGLIRNLDFTLTVIGKEKNERQFRSQAEQLGIGDKVDFLGVQKNVLPYYQQADALVIPSLYDPFANVTVEALAMGLFVLSSPYNGGKEVLSAGSGHLIENLNQPESMASSLVFAMKHPKTEKQATQIRQSIQHLDFSLQLQKIVEKTLK